MLRRGGAGARGRREKIKFNLYLFLIKSKHKINITFIILCYNIDNYNYYNLTKRIMSFNTKVVEGFAEVCKCWGIGLKSAQGQAKQDFGSGLSKDLLNDIGKVVAKIYSQIEKSPKSKDRLEDVDVLTISREVVQLTADMAADGIRFREMRRVVENSFRNLNSQTIYKALERLMQETYYTMRRGLPQEAEHIGGRSFFSYLKNNVDEVDKIEELKRKHLPLDWCLCGNASLENRIQLIERVIRDVLDEYPDKEEPLCIVSLGAGYLFQDYCLLKTLYEVGYTTLTLVPIDPQYGLKGGNNVIDVLKDQFEKEGVEVRGNFVQEKNSLTVASFTAHEDYLARGKHFKGDIFLLVDGSFPFAKQIFNTIVEKNQYNSEKVIAYSAIKGQVRRTW